jgi:phytanoyl-CoA hydroxylase
MEPRHFLEENGYAILVSFMEASELAWFSSLYNDFLANKYDLTGLRSDLSGIANQNQGPEKITQIMRPALLVPSLLETSTYNKILAFSRDWMGEDMAIDFDMMIDKAPGTATITPWHQDAAYWPEQADKRAISFWMALDAADRENGCMMYVPGSHRLPLRPHIQPERGGALTCQLKETDPIAYGVIQAGDAIAHHGFTLHGALGNHSPDRHRRALIVNLRPQGMIDYIRSLGYDHLGTRKVK